MKRHIDFSLYFIADHALPGRRNISMIIEQAIAGGATVIQLRGKQMDTRSYIAWAVAVKCTTSEFKIPLIVNDRVDVAMAANADGVHLGQEDMPVATARKLLGKGKIIGISTHTAQEARSAEKAGADYVGAGTVFATSSKKNIRGLLGGDGLKRIRKAVTIPVVAIGGITAQNISEVMRSGVAGVAVISAILHSADPKQTCEIFQSIIRKHKLQQKHG
jgi:thiamine-phosphate pyrophosphorylase